MQFKYENTRHLNYYFYCYALPHTPMAVLHSYWLALNMITLNLVCPAPTSKSFWSPYGPQWRINGKQLGNALLASTAL